MHCMRKYFKLSQVNVIRMSSFIVGSVYSPPRNQQLALWCCLKDRRFGGYIEDAQLAVYGLEIYQEIHEPFSKPSSAYIIPDADEQ